MDYYGYQDSREIDVPLIVTETISDLIDKNFKGNGSIVYASQIRRSIKKRTQKRLDGRWRNIKNSAYTNSYWIEKISEKFENEGWTVYYDDGKNCLYCRNPYFVFLKQNK